MNWVSNGSKTSIKSRCLEWTEWTTKHVRFPWPGWRIPQNRFCWFILILDVCKYRMSFHSHHFKGSALLSQFMRLPVLHFNYGKGISCNAYIIIESYISYHIKHLYIYNIHTQTRYSIIIYNLCRKYIILLYYQIAQPYFLTPVSILSFLALLASGVSAEPALLKA